MGGDGRSVEGLVGLFRVTGPVGVAEELLVEPVGVGLPESLDLVHLVQGHADLEEGVGEDQGVDIVSEDAMGLEEPAVFPEVG